jgi:SAM-dependent methyltransferase
VTEPEVDIAPLYDAYLDQVYSDDSLVRELVDFVKSRSIVSVLDCAAGTGFPALQMADILGDGVVVHCTDGSSRMIARLREKVDPALLHRFVPPRRSVSVGDPMVCVWDDLDDLSEEYSLVMCRGNSLVYHGAWSQDREQVATADDIRRSIESISRRVAPGGFLYLDGPRSLELPPRTLGDLVAMEESVTVLGASREWSLTVSLPTGEQLSLVRHSALLTIDDIASMIDGSVLANLERNPFRSERRAFGSVVAQRIG